MCSSDLAINRIIEINCENIKLFPDPGAVLRTIKLNYGYAGKDFIEKVLSGNNVIGDAKCIYDAFYKKMVSGATEKQAMAAALILTADTVADLLIFKDGKAMTVGDINKYRYVGMSGQKFSGNLYIACGISGAKQHLKGIKTASTTH